MLLKFRPILPVSVFTLVLSLILPSIGRAACHVITSTGGGTNSGADWNNPCHGFSGNCAGSAMLRGDTYYVAGGSGGSYTNPNNAPVLKVSTAVSGTTPITIKAATAADHCTSTGWVPATMAVDGGAGQADFVTAGNAVLEASTSYVVFDGNFSAADTSNSWGNPGHACAGTQCGILADQRVISPASASSLVTYGVYIDTGVTNIAIRSMEFWGAWNTAGSAGIATDTIRSVGGSNYTVTHNYLHDSSQDFVMYQSVTNSSIMYNYMYKNYSHVVSPAIHGACVSIHGGVNNLTVAFNAFRDLQGTGCLSLVSGGPTTNDSVLFYGNILWMTSGNPNALAGGYDNGIVSCTNGQVCTNWQVYNNTVVNESISTNNSLNGGTPGSGSSIKVYNNLFYNSAYANNQCVNWTGSCVYDYNVYSGTIQNTPGAHDQTISGVPFVSWITANFHLVADNSAWYSLSSPFNVDMDGVGRSSSRGAYQYVSGTSATTAPPSSLTATVQ